jgi:hypothetical protein
VAEDVIPPLLPVFHNAMQQIGIVFSEELTMYLKSCFQRRLYLFLGLFLIALPAIVFYAILWKNAVRIPILDDYDIVLAAGNYISQCHGFMPKLVYVLTAQHNGYKLILENVVVIAQYSLFGKITFFPLVALGNAFALLIFLTVCSMSRLAPGDLAKRCLFLVPVAYLLFQLQYASALDFVSSSLQHLAVISFSLLSIAFLSKVSLRSMACASVLLLFAIGSSPNGFFVVPVGILILAQTKRWRQMTAWVLIAALALSVYLFRYSDMSSQAGTHGSAGSLAHFNILYALSFLGASAARYISLTTSLTLGLVLFGIFLFALRRRYFQRNPAVFYSMIFILINAIVVSGLRSDLGLAQSLASRYRIYSNLFLAFSYIFLIEDLLPLLKRKSLRRGVLLGTLVLSVVFCALSDLAGARFLQGKKQALTHSYKVEWLQDKSVANEAQVSGNPALQNQFDKGVFEIRVPIMQESVRLGVFQPPPDSP